MNRKLPIYLSLLSLGSCLGTYDQKPYRTVENGYVQEMTIRETLLKNSKVLVVNALDSVSDKYPKLLVKSNKSKKFYLFNIDCNCELENDSIVIAYSPSFLIDSDGDFRKDGLWVYTNFRSDGKDFGVDSIPQKWNKQRPKQEGIYFFRNNSLVRISEEQSEKKFNEQKKSGFYFFPNKGCLFDRININHLE